MTSIRGKQQDAGGWQCTEIFAQACERKTQRAKEHTRSALAHLAVVWHGHYPAVRLDGAERVVGCLSLAALAQCIEQRGLQPAKGPCQVRCSLHALTGGQQLQAPSATAAPQAWGMLKQAVPCRRSAGPQCRSSSPWSRSYTCGTEYVVQRACSAKLVDSAKPSCV